MSLLAYVLWSAAVLSAAAATFVYNNLSGRTLRMPEIEKRRRNRRALTMLLTGLALVLTIAGWDAR